MVELFFSEDKYNCKYGKGQILVNEKGNHHLNGDLYEACCVSGDREVLGERLQKARWGL